LTIVKVLGKVALLICFGTFAFSCTINFDDLDASSGDILLDTLNSYQGFSWTNFSVYTNIPGFPGFNNGIVSAPNAAYTSGDAQGSAIVSTITASTPFDFVSAYVGSGWYDGLSATFEGFDAGTEIFSKSVTVNTSGPQLLAFNINSVDEVRVFSTMTSATADPYGCGSSGCSQLTLDDVTITPAVRPPPSVPEPSTLLLPVIGVSALTVLRRILLPSC